MFLDVKFVFNILFLISLMCTFHGANTISIPNVEGLVRRNSSIDMNTMCGFSFVYPPANSSTTDPITIKNGTTITCKWSTQPGSRVVSVVDFELFKDSGMMITLWNKGVNVTQNSASVDIMIYAPSGMNLPDTFLARSWANTDFGPHCTAYSQHFKITT